MARMWLSQGTGAMLALGLPAVALSLLLLVAGEVVLRCLRLTQSLIRRLRSVRPHGLLLAGFLLPVTAACGLQGITSVPTRTTVPAPVAATAPAVSMNSSAELRALQSEFVSVVKAVGPSVVQIDTRTGLGSGIIFDPQGDIVTNAHVVGNSQQFNVTLSNGREYAGRLIGTFVADDLAVIKIDGGPFPAATFGDSAQLQVGDIVMAIGNPLGLQSSVTEGIVSAVGRTLSEQNGATLNDLIQTSAAINPGNSGGALVDLRGQVVGIPTLAATNQGGAAAGIGFAIPSNTVKDIATQLVQSGKVTNSHRAYLGVQLASTQGGGVLVTSVVTGGPADRAGIRNGDLVTAIDGRTTASSQALSASLAGHKPGDTVSLSIQRRAGGTETVKVALGQYPG